MLIRTILIAMTLPAIALFGGLPAQEVPVKPKPLMRAPDTVSSEARKYFESLSDAAATPAFPAPNDRDAWKRVWEAKEAASKPLVEAVLKRFEPMVTDRKLGGVTVLDIKPKGWKESRKVLIHLHGGCYTLHSAWSRLPSSVLSADATGLRVITVDYTVAPVGKWEKVVDEVIAVIDGLKKEGHKVTDIAIYGESAGGALAAGAVLKMRDQGLGMPAAVVLWSPWSDITDRGESAVTIKDLEPFHRYDMHLKNCADAYADPKDQKHPYVSPVYGDYSKGFPPTLIQGGTREIFMSHFVRHYRAIDDAGGSAILDLYEGMPHVFQMRPGMTDAPETKAAMKKMTRFLNEHLTAR